MPLLLLPNQLFEKALNSEAEKVYLVEDERFFTQFDYHRQKLVLHRASMKAFADRLEEEGKEVEYVTYEEGSEAVFEEADELTMFDPVDHEVSERLESLAEEHGADLKVTGTPMFLNSMEWNREYFSDSEYFQLEYYKEVRRKEDVLVDEGSPVGGKWSFDPENRKKMPEDVEPPEIPQFSSEYVDEAKEYVEENFSGNPGSMEGFFWPVTYRQARENLEDFLENRLEKFGDYQDALDSDLRYGFHSLLSSSINIGLLTPGEVVEKTLEAHEENEYPMNSLEGFLRQVIGWREYIRALYELEGEEMRSRNFFGCDEPLPDAFYSGDTGLPPVDDSIGNALEDAYCHHIERLMVLGNVMLLLETDPDEVYDWFMEMFIDAYDWVMVPNVYGMSQYADPRIMTKPYISSSNYIGKMSHYDGGDWEDAWDGLYWRFIKEHREKISDIQRMSFMTSTLDRMNDETVEEHVRNAEEFAEGL